MTLIHDTTQVGLGVGGLSKVGGVQFVCVNPKYSIFQELEQLLERKVPAL